MNRKLERRTLLVMSAIAVFLLPFAIYKRSFKDWLIVFLVSCIGNSFADRYLVSKGFLKYKVRPFKDKLAIHFPFDFLHYPLFLLYYNQWTLNSKPIGIFLKLFPFIIPQVIFETVVEKYTDLITWKKGWNWYHSFFSLMIKFLLCRFIISLVRKLNHKQVSTL